MTTNFTTRKANKAFLLSLLLLLVYIITLIFLGHPLPHRDDLIFIGTPIHAVQNGEFINPYCEGFLKQLGTIEHLYYMPGQVWLLYFWFVFFGISTVSLLSFQWSGLIIGMSCLYIFTTKKLRLSKSLFVLLSGIYLTIFIVMGLRPDAWGFGLSFAGLAVLNHDNFKKLLIGITLGGLGILCSPLSMAIFFPMALYLGMHGLKSKNWKNFFVAGIIGVTMIVLLLGWMIQFRFQTFYEIFKQHSMLQKDGLNSFVQFFDIICYKHNLVLKLPLFALGAVIAIIAVFKKGGTAKAAIFLFASLILSIALYAEKTVYVSGQIICWLLLALGYQLFSTIKWKKLYSIGLCLLFLVSQSPYLTALLGQRNTPEIKSSILAQTLNYKYIVGDAVVARNIYDYKLPDNYKSLEFFTKDYYPPSIKQCLSDEIWIFSPAYSIVLPQAGVIPSAKLKIAGKEFSSIAKNQYELQIVKYPTNNNLP